MPVTFNTSRVNGIAAAFKDLNESRIKRLMSGNRDEALYMGFWDKIRDLFRPQKKAKVLKALWNLMHPEQNNGTPAAAGSREELTGALYAFHKLMDLADESRRDKFNLRLTTERSGYGYFVNADFRVKGKSVRTTSYCPDDPDEGRADLSGADLSGADLSGADLRGADLSGADLSGADLTDAGLTGADLTGAWLNGATYNGVSLTQENFSSYFPYAHGVESVHWEAKSDVRAVRMYV